MGTCSKTALLDVHVGHIIEPGSSVAQEQLTSNAAGPLSVTLPRTWGEVNSLQPESSSCTQHLMWKQAIEKSWQVGVSLPTLL